MAVNKTPIATDSAAELRGLVGDDATAEFESDPKFIDSNPTDHASSEHVTLRDSDDTEDSEEEIDEEDDEEDDEDEEEDEEDEDEEDEESDEDFDEDFDDEEEDDTEEFGSIVMRAA
jgi:hypothetical protein